MKFPKIQLYSFTAKDDILNESLYKSLNTQVACNSIIALKSKIDPLLGLDISPAVIME